MWKHENVHWGMSLISLVKNMRGQNTAEKHQNKTEFDQRAHYNYLGPNNYNLKKKPFHQVQQYTDQYTERFLSMSLMKIAHAGLRKALQVFGDKQTKQNLNKPQKAASLSQELIFQIFLQGSITAI